MRATEKANRAVALLGALMVLSTGCVMNEGLDEGDTHTVRRLEIQGGTTDNAHTSVVGILIAVGNAQAICSGTLIAPNLVLTAQHCVAELTSQYVICGQSPFGSTFPPSAFHVTTQTTMPQTNDGYYNVSAVHVPPGGNDTCGYDIALLELSTSIPETETRPITPRIDVPVAEGDTYTAVGYGHTGNGSGAGTRRQIGGREVLCATGDCPTGQGIDGREFAGTDGTCQGDSGGAALDEQGRVLGALSRGPDGCAGSVYSSVGAWADWMREVGELAATAGGYTAPLWVSRGISEAPANDVDLDGVLNDVDNCPDTPNVEQGDLDADGFGDECDGDIDGDNVNNDVDNCPLYENFDQADNDADTFGDVCDLDDDNDGIVDEEDNCRFMANAAQDDICYGNPSMGGTPSTDGTGNGTFGNGGTGRTGGTTNPGEPQIHVLPDAIHMEGRMSCSVGAGQPQNFGVLGLLLFGGLAVGRRRRR